MALPKVLALVAVLLFAAIGVGAILKKGKTKHEEIVIETAMAAPTSIEVELEREVRPITPPPMEASHEAPQMAGPSIEAGTVSIDTKAWPLPADDLPEATRIEELFNKADPRLPYVETITYQSRVGWQKGRPAWLSDYAAHYKTSRHFIARSLNGKPDYFKQDVAEGDRFNVLRLDKNISFYLLIDISRSKMWFYSYDKDTNERILLKTYLVGLGRLDNSNKSGLLTPLGKYALGSKIAIYRPKMMGFHNGQKVEMVRIFGSRWIPFEKELGENTAPAKGFGIHGVPWVDSPKGELAQDVSSIGKYESDGCVRLTCADIEEIFAIIITKPTVVELVKEFYDAKLPGEELGQH